MDKALRKVEIGAKIICLLELKAYIQKQIDELGRQEDALNNNRSSTKE